VTVQAEPDALVPKQRSPSAPILPQRLPNSDFDRRIVAVLAIEPERLGRMQRRLRQEPRCRSVVSLRGMDKKGMT
jgi:hypothetical protein